MDGVQSSYDITHGATYTHDKKTNWPLMTLMTLLTLLTKGPKRVKICCKHLFLAIFISVTSYSTHTIVLWANQWCPVIPYYHLRCFLHSWPHIVTLWAILDTKSHWKNMFLAISTSTTSYSTHDIVYGPMNGVQSFYDMTHGDTYTHNPIYLPYGPW
jgi:hypothetical protein